MKNLKGFIGLTGIIYIVLISMAVLSGCQSTNLNNTKTSTDSDINTVAQTSSSSDQGYEIILRSKEETIFNDELWVKYPDGKEEKLVTEKPDDDVKKNIGKIRAAEFSPDKSKIYFETEAWVTSGAVHEIEIKTKKEKYLCPGSLVAVIPSGPYMGNLVVNQHRYKKDGGSYDHYFLVDEKGGEIKDLGEEFLMEQFIK